MIASLPALGGSYILIFRLTDKVEAVVGRLGSVTFNPAVYYYCGSALGRGGLRGRLSHHLKYPQKPHWHVDYLQPYRDLLEVLYLSNGEKLECEFSQYLARQPSAFIPVKGFGASDCVKGCGSHLIGFDEKQHMEILRKFTLAWDLKRLHIR